MYRYGEARAGRVSFSTGDITPGKDGVSVDDLKEDLKKRALSPTGNKLALVRVVATLPGGVRLVTYWPSSTGTLVF